MRTYKLLGMVLLSSVHFAHAQEPIKENDKPTVRYSITDLGTLGGEFSTANAINNKGEIAGQASDKDGQSRAVKWVGGKIVDCGFGADSSNALDINEAGLMAGYSGKTFGTSSRAIYWSADGKPVLLGLSDDWKEGGSALRAVNNKNQFVGYGSDAMDGEVEGNAQGFLFSLDESSVAPLKGADVNIIANGVNDSGETVLTVSYDGQQRPWKWKKALELAIEGNVQALDINNKGQVALCMKGSRAGRLETEGNQTALILCGVGLPARINNEGVMVGIGEGGATLFEKRQAIDLNTLIPADSGWKLSSANGINDSGQIVGFGEYKESKMRAFLLTPTKKTSILDALKLPD